MKQEQFTINGCGGRDLPCTLWLPETTLRAVLQVTHGMTEHMGRYAKLAHVLTSCGVAVVGFDLRGHGMNGTDPNCASFGEGGWEASLEDMHLVRGHVQNRFMDAPFFMLGFSLGSFLLREYLSRYGTVGIAGAVLMGTGHQPVGVLKVMKAIVKGQIKKCGFDGTTALVQKLSFDTYNKKITHRRTRADWLCSDDDELDAYLADELCRESISAGLFWQLLDAMQRTGAEGAYDNWDQSFPVLLLSGQDDPVGDYGKGVKAVEDAMAKAGMTCVDSRMYPIVRHDLLHEEHSSTAPKVRSLIFEFICKHL